MGLLHDKKIRQQYKERYGENWEEVFNEDIDMRQYLMRTYGTNRGEREFIKWLREMKRHNFFPLEYWWQNENLPRHTKRKKSLENIDSEFKVADETTGELEYPKSFEEKNGMAA